jgi:hypothetical protein
MCKNGFKNKELPESGNSSILLVHFFEQNTFFRHLDDKTG